MPTFITVLIGVLLVSGQAALAAPAQRARLSADLQDHLNAGSQAIEIIVHGDKATVDALAARYGVVVRKYLAVGGAVLQVTAGQLAAIQGDGSVDHISGNVRIRATDAVTAETIGADQVWASADAGPGLNGSGVVVAVIDSGMDPTHAALHDRIVATHDFTGGDGVDRFGHGTHVAGIIGGAPVATANGADYRGIAWGAKLVNLRVLDAEGAGTVSDVVDAIDWAIANRDRYKIRVINLSLGAPVLQPYRDDPMCEAVERAVRAGLVVVAAAGNYGRTTTGQTVLGSITSPANDPFAIAVGAIDTHGTPDRSDDTIAPYSSRGPTAYDLILKPDLAAPGQHIASAQAADAYLPTTYPSRHVTGEGADAYFDLSGTSMSAAVVSGASAVLLSGRDKLLPNQTKVALQLSASFMPQYGVIGAGAGSVNLLAAVGLIEHEEVPLDKSLPAIEDETTKTPLGTVTPQQVLQLIGQSSKDGGAKDAFASPLSDPSIVWGGTANSIVWGVNANSIVWGVTANSIVWGVNANSIVWGVDANSIVWGVKSNSIVWGVTANSIVWGVTPDSIVWGVTGSSIVWGVTDSSIVWGISPDSIVWGVDSNSNSNGAL